MELFRRNINRVSVSFAGYGLVPVASEFDDTPQFETAPPRRIGDDAIIFVEGKRRKVRLLKSQGISQGTYLVDLGSAHVAVTPKGDWR